MFTLIFSYMMLLMRFPRFLTPWKECSNVLLFFCSKDFPQLLSTYRLELVLIYNVKDLTSRMFCVFVCLCILFYTTLLYISAYSGACLCVSCVCFVCEFYVFCI